MVRLLPGKDSKSPEFYQVVELKGSQVSKQSEVKVILVPHADARRAKAKGVSVYRDEVPRTAKQIKELAVDPRKIKVVIDPLGRDRWANDQADY